MKPNLEPQTFGNLDHLPDVARRFAIFQIADKSHPGSRSQSEVRLLKLEFLSPSAKSLSDDLGCHNFSRWGIFTETTVKIKQIIPDRVDFDGL
ncbi:MAG TPA: hypothetical protein VNQ90_18125 [Chthoniobacteraceae bacterium]|nr:hypothetical protein [Chthoniobacteraceae bacterium]